MLTRVYVTYAMSSSCNKEIIKQSTSVRILVQQVKNYIEQNWSWTLVKHSEIFILPVKLWSLWNNQKCNWGGEICKIFEC